MITIFRPQSFSVFSICLFISPLSDHSNTPFRLRFPSQAPLWLLTPTTPQQCLVRGEELCSELSLLWCPGRRFLHLHWLGYLLMQMRSFPLDACCPVPASLLPTLIKAVTQSTSHPDAPPPSPAPRRPPPLFMALPVALILMCTLLAG